MTQAPVMLFVPPSCRAGYPCAEAIQWAQSMAAAGKIRSWPGYGSAGGYSLFTMGVDYSAGYVSAYIGDRTFGSFDEAAWSAYVDQYNAPAPAPMPPTRSVGPSLQPSQPPSMSFTPRGGSSPFGFGTGVAMNRATMIQTGIGMVGVGAGPVSALFYVEKDPSGNMCPACAQALTWADANGPNTVAPAGYYDAGGYGLRFDTDAGMPADLLQQLATIGISSPTYPTAVIGGTVIAGFDQTKYDAALKGAGGAPASGGGGLSPTSKALLIGAGVLAAGGLGYMLLKPKKKHHRKHH